MCGFAAKLQEREKDPKSTESRQRNRKYQDR